MCRTGFCYQDDNEGFAGAGGGGAAGGGVGGGAAGGGFFESITADWFKDWAGVIALIITLIMLLFNRG